jgi:hypothetical protein
MTEPAEVLQKRVSMFLSQKENLPLSSNLQHNVFLK